MLTALDKVRIDKGCAARGISKNATAQIVSITPLGADYSHHVKIVFRMLNGRNAGKTFGFFAQHVNRLSDPTVRVNDGNPFHVVVLRRG